MIEVHAQPFVASRWKRPSVPTRMNGSRMADTSPVGVSTGFNPCSVRQWRPSTLVAKYSDSSPAAK